MFVKVACVRGVPVWGGTEEEVERFEKAFHEWFKVQCEFQERGWETHPFWYETKIQFPTSWAEIVWHEIEVDGVEHAS